MRLGDQWLVLDTVSSTQTEAAALFIAGEEVDVVFAHDQIGGKGRFGRTWFSSRGSSLTMSLIFRDYAEHPAPWLIGMASALAASEVISSQLQWPNDLVFGSKKVGGILTELLPNQEGSLCPVVGIGINVLRQNLQPELEDFSTNFEQELGSKLDPQLLANRIVEQIRRMPDVSSWQDIVESWMKRDATPGKKFKLANGQTVLAEGIDDQGRLVAVVDGQLISIMAAEAIFGK